MTDSNPYLWATAERQGRAHSFDMINLTLELRARIEALEAGARCPYVVTSDEGTSYCTLAEANAKPTPNPSQIRSSLVEQVASAIAQDDENIDWRPEARAAICEVAAAALRMHPDPNLTWERVALWLEQEAER